MAGVAMGTAAVVTEADMAAGDMDAAATDYGGRQQKTAPPGEARRCAESFKQFNLANTYGSGTVAMVWRIRLAIL